MTVSMVDGRESRGVRSRRNLTWALALPAVGLLAFVCIIPLVVLFALSFAEGGVPTLAHYQRIFTSPAYLTILQTTFALSVGVMILAVLLGYPLCYFIATLPEKWRPLALALVSLPLWTSILVRTFAWQILLQRRGVINTALMDAGIIDQPLQLAFTLWGAMLGMVHIVLPLFVLPVYVAMTQIDRRLLQAASSLGASNSRVFWTVFVPLSLPGVAAGMLIVFIYALGFYITPQILGGGRVITVSMKVAENATMYAEWGAASSLGAVLLVVAGLAIGLASWLAKAVASGARS